MGMLKRSAVLLLPVLSLGALPARAQAPPIREPPRFFGIFTPTVGGWSEYAVTETEGGKKSTMRNAIVGKEGDAFWYEVAITEGGVRNVIKMFLKGDPNNPENIQRLIMKNGDQPAQEMPREFVMMGRRMATSMFESRSGSSVANQPNLKFEEVGTREGEGARRDVHRVTRTGWSTPRGRSWRRTTTTRTSSRSASCARKPTR